MQLLVKFALKVRGSLNQVGDYDYISKIDMGEKIPKIVHQTYSTKDLPALIKSNIDKLKAHNPEWDFRLYDDEDISKYIETNYPKLLVIYNKINPKYGAARADFFRYLLMYKDGGVYLDIKSGAKKPLSQILRDTDKFILCHWSKSFDDGKWGVHPGVSTSNGELQQWHIIAVKGHPFLKSVIENVCNNIKHYNPIIHDYGLWGVVNLTGPIAYTESIYPMLTNYPNRLENDHEDLGLIYVAIDSNDAKFGHRKVFEKKHYSLLEESIVKQPFYTAFLFNIIKPIIKQLKLIKNSK